MNNAIPYLPDDVCSQICELSFDFSVHEIYLALLNGCVLCPARSIDLFNPTHFISKHSITVWIAVPSMARVALKNGISIDGKLNNIRVSIFNGEALTSRLAMDWHCQAPYTEIWNTYGPTECTVAVTAQRWNSDKSLIDAEIISIGKSFPDCITALLVNEKIVATSEVQDDCIGELLLSTPQQFHGYTNQKLNSPFISDNNGTKYYKTGDLALIRSGKLFHRGRIDTQVKIKGHRIELLEIEHRIRTFYENEAIAVIANPQKQPSEIVLFTENGFVNSPIDFTNLGLPNYMIPNRIISLKSLPQNQHGKLDRIALQKLAESSN